MTSIANTMALAIQHFQAQRLPDAERLCRQVLAHDPRQVDALHLLGVVLAHRGQMESGSDFVRQALALKPDYAAAHNSLGILLQEQGRMAEATNSFRNVLRYMPNLPEAHNNLGNALRIQGNCESAAASYREAVRHKPDFAEAHYNLGIVLSDLKQLDEAKASYRAALALRPNFAGAHYNLGNALRDSGELDAALASYREALRYQPDHADALNNLGNTLREQGKLQEALATFRAATRIRPDFPGLHYNLGNVLSELDHSDEAAACYREAIRLNPGYIPPMGALVHELQRQCAWQELPVLCERVIQSVRQTEKQTRDTLVSPLAFVALAVPTTPGEQQICASRWADHGLIRGKLEERGEKAPLVPRTTRHGSSPLITLGYLSADFHDHATTRLIVELFEKHDRRHFAVFGYSYGRDDGSAMRGRLVKAFDRFVDLSQVSDAESARRIRTDGVDLLIDLKGYTLYGRTNILALRPAPIQVNYLGYPGTMGAAFMDYILVDDFLVPAGQERYFTEKLVKLPGCYQVNDSQRKIAERTPSRSECGLPPPLPSPGAGEGKGGGFVFCSFNNNYKITPAMFDVWMKLLNAVPHSVLWLLEGNPAVADNLRREAEIRGVAGGRCVFAPRLGLAEHLARHRLADLFLDTFPVNAHTTASEALWAGCPLLTLAGNTFVSRVAGSLLTTLGLPELITTSLEEYQEMALRLAREPELLAQLRARLASNRESSGLFDGERFARKVEAAYAAMWQRFSAGAE